VLRIGKLGASPDQVAYYEQQVAQGLEDYLSGRGESPGRWIGGGCGGIGVAGRVDRDGFMRAMAGCDPRTGAALRPPRDGDDRGSVGCAARGSSRRPTGTGCRALATRSCTRTRWLRTSREPRVDGQRSRLIACTSTHSRAGPSTGRVLRAEVRERLPWVWWREAGRGLFEIEGVPDKVPREFSRRRVEIEERAVELTGVGAAMLSRERLQRIALATRKAKAYGVDGGRWRQEARTRVAEHGFGQREVERLTALGSRMIGVSDADVVRQASARLSGPEGLTEQHNTFTRRHALAGIAGEFEQGASVARLERATSSYLEHRTVVPLGRLDHEHRLTTRDLLAAEQTIIEGAERRRHPLTGVVHPRLPDLVMAGLPASLSEEQRNAVRFLATDGAGVSALQALAGTGKTWVLGVLARVYETAGYSVVGVAPPT